MNQADVIGLAKQPGQRNMQASQQGGLKAYANPEPACLKKGSLASKLARVSPKGGPQTYTRHSWPVRMPEIELIRVIPSLHLPDRLQGTKGDKRHDDGAGVSKGADQK
eukprot:1133613-Pelagomonas_calceolata.AAC.2